MTASGPQHQPAREERRRPLRLKRSADPLPFVGSVVGIAQVLLATAVVVAGAAVVALIVSLLF